MQKKDHKLSFGDRFMAMLASLIFSIPTAIFLWLGLNVELGLHWHSFINTSYLWATIGVFAVLSFITPKLFPSILGKIWSGIIKFQKWFG